MRVCIYPSCAMMHSSDGAPGVDRTPDRLLTRQMLYRLSYRGKADWLLHRHRMHLDIDGVVNHADPHSLSKGSLRIQTPSARIVCGTRSQQ